MSFSDFSSWPRDQEQSFVVYEQRNNESTKKAYTLGAIAGVLFLIFFVGVYAGVEPDKKDMTKGMNMNNLTKKSKKVDAPAPAPDPAPAPKAEAPAAAPEAPAAAPAEEKK